jgi:tight adherence protein B
MLGLAAILFLVFFGVTLLAVGVAYRVLETARQRKMEQVLKTVAAADLSPTTTVRPITLRNQPSPMSTWLLQYLLFRKIHEAIRCAALDWTVEGVVVMSLVLAAVGAFVGSLFHLLVIPWLSIAALSLLFALVPIWFVYKKRAARLAAFEKQFPEALDFTARSVRAGHGMAVSLEMLAAESDAPLSVEFRQLANELSLGTAFDVSLRNLASRVPLVDVRLFAAAVLMQRETGGNLAQILTSIATLIRVRFQLKGQVKALTAHGRITAAVLTVLPILIAVGMSFMSPGYIPGMLASAVGRKMAFGAISGQVLGYFVMKRMVNIKV